MRNAYFILPTFIVILFSLSSQAKIFFKDGSAVPSCSHGIPYRGSLKVIGEGLLRSGENTVGTYTIESIVCRDDLTKHDSTDLKEMLTLNLQLNKHIPGLSLDLSSFNDGELVYSQLFETESPLIFLDFVSGKKVRLGEDERGLLHREVQATIDNGYPLPHQLFSNFWAHDFILPLAPFFMSVKTLVPDSRPLACGLKAMNLKLAVRTPSFSRKSPEEVMIEMEHHSTPNKELCP